MEMLGRMSSNRRSRAALIVMAAFVAAVVGGCGTEGGRDGEARPTAPAAGDSGSVQQGLLELFSPPLQIDRVLTGNDADGDGIDDLVDIVGGAREYVATRPRYEDGYYAGGYPPDGVGVCTDVVWRALGAAGYELKALVDADIAAEPAAYPRVAGRPDPNIDFRRVKNLQVFLGRHATTLTTDVRPGDAGNLGQWQGGDIVVFGPPLQHIGIVSNRRRRDGVPYVLHNPGPWACEQDCLTSWPAPIIGHFRFPKAE